MKKYKLLFVTMLTMLCAVGVVSWFYPPDAMERVEVRGVTLEYFECDSHIIIKPEDFRILVDMAKGE